MTTLVIRRSTSARDAPCTTTVPIPVVHRLGMRAHRPAEGILEPADHHTRQRTEPLGWRLVEHTTPDE
ncbi:MAG TPA: hypothetical protein VFQ48_05455 [Pseudonocardiaceae bacterium]|nr:hypothetical protein [Pseudonocardiaceae bacterium]